MIRGAIIPGAKTSSWMSPTSAPTGDTGDPYSAAVHQQASDYDEIMGNYRNLFGSSQSRPELKLNPLQPQQTNFTSQSYTPTEGFNDLRSKLNTNTETGGYSPEDLNALRARGISPIRAIYAAALRNISRQKNLSGGYAPNYGALQAKLAREQSAALGDANIKVNADIADRVASGKQFALSTLAPMAAQDNQLSNAANANNAAGMNRVSEFNANARSEADRINASMLAEFERINAANANQVFDNKMNATQGMQSLYGTTPALTQTFGNQVLASNAQKMQGQTATNSAIQQGAKPVGIRGVAVPRFGG
jgi:hypothetical protein